MPNDQPQRSTVPVYLSALAAEAEANDRAGSSMSWANAQPDERPRILIDAATTRANGRAQLGELVRPLTEDELGMLTMIEEARQEREGSGPEQPRIGTRTAADLWHGPPPDQLADPFLTAEGATVVYAKGGTGKGIFACWLAHRLVTAGHVVLILDYEGHEREWGSRLRGLGLTDDELSRVHYRAPFGRDWTAPTGALSAVADLVRVDCERLSVTYILVDSYSVATSNGDTMGGEAAAREYFNGLTRIGRPSLTIAHVKGDAEKFPDRPFGSVFVHNLARETWAVARTGDDEPETLDPDEIQYGPHVVSLELRNRKSNGRPATRAQFVTFSFYADGSIGVADDRPRRSVADLAADVLGDGPLTIAAIAKAIREDTGEVVTQDTLLKTLRRHPRRFVSSQTRPRTWTVQ